LDNFAGSIERLRNAYDAVNALYPVAWAPNSLIDAMQAGDRLTYHPEKAREELTRFHQSYTLAVSSLEKMATGVSEKQLVSEKKQHAASQFQRALAQVKDGDPSGNGGR
jgi:hypothetical protein